MKELNEISFKDKDAIFGRLEQIASQANLSKEERAQYEYEWKVYNDYFNTLESGEKKARAEGLEKGMEKGMEQSLEIMKIRDGVLRAVGAPGERICL